MRTIAASLISEKIYELILDVNFGLSQDVRDALVSSEKTCENPLGRFVLNGLLANADIAQKQRVPLCQDTGTAVFFIEIGQDVKIEGESLNSLVNSAVGKAYTDGFLRKSIVLSPVLRSPISPDNTPAVIWTEIVPGEGFSVSFMAKGGGSENASTFATLDPNSTVDDICGHIVKTVLEKGPNACPPLLVGVGIGGTTEQSAYHAKKVLLRTIGQRNPEDYISQMEIAIKNKINAEGFGPGGFGGSPTVLDVFIECLPCHIASLPVFINIMCNSSRHATIKL